MIKASGCTLIEAFPNEPLTKNKKENIIRDVSTINKTKKEETLKKENLKEETSKEETPKEETPKEEIPKEETKKENINKEDKYKEVFNDLRKYFASINKVSTKENFANFNDDFNDVLLFALLGFFYLIFTDYIYKLGKKSY